MIKYLGACMIFSGCLGLGMWYRAQFFGRIRALQSMEYMLELLAGEIRYGRSTLPECCLHVTKYLKQPFDVAFCNISQRMAENEGLSFGAVFVEEVQEGLRALPIKPEDEEVFLRFATQAGFADGQMQLHTLEQSKDMLRQTQEKLEKENAEKCRMAVGLGAMGGLLLLLILW